MGNDGGTIVRRADLVRVREEGTKANVDPAILARVLATTCTLSRESLRRPIVADRLGHMFNKDALVRYLLRRAQLNVSDTDPSAAPSAATLAQARLDDTVASHIRTLKDVYTLQLTDNPAFDQAQKAKLDQAETLMAPFLCPLTQKDMNGRYRFVFLRPCGCVLSESGLRATWDAGKGGDKAACPICGVNFSTSCLGKKEVLPGGDVVVLNGTEAEVEAQLQAMLTERKEEKARKKAAKASKATGKESAVEASFIPDERKRKVPDEGETTVPVSTNDEVKRIKLPQTNATH